jgi:hypothetical protein
MCEDDKRLLREAAELMEEAASALMRAGGMLNKDLAKALTEKRAQLVSRMNAT